MFTICQIISTRYASITIQVVPYRFRIALLFCVNTKCSISSLAKILHTKMKNLISHRVIISIFNKAFILSRYYVSYIFQIICSYFFTDTVFCSSNWTIISKFISHLTHNIYLIGMWHQVGISVSWGKSISFLETKSCCPCCSPIVFIHTTDERFSEDAFASTFAAMTNDVNI